MKSTLQQYTVLRNPCIVMVINYHKHAKTSMAVCPLTANMCSFDLNNNKHEYICIALIYMRKNNIWASSWENQQSAYAKPKAQISFAVTAKLISAFVFATRIVQFLFYLNPKFQASSSFLCLYWPVCVWPARKPHCWFSHEAAHILYKQHMHVLCYSGKIKLMLDVPFSVG